MFFGPSSVGVANQLDTDDLFPNTFTSPLSRIPEPTEGLGIRLAHAKPRGYPLVVENLLNIAVAYSLEDDIPYIWGGNQAGDPSACQACRNCVKRKKPPIEVRKQVCTPCKKCGFDCSHFVHRVYNDSGLKYPYGNTLVLNRLNRTALFERYGVADLGPNPQRARPGDLLLYGKHIVMLLRKTGPNTGDVVHVTRLGDRFNLGGIRIERDKDLRTFRGQLRRILRHSVVKTATEPRIRAS